jgi:hypothetical protein
MSVKDGLAMNATPGPRRLDGIQDSERPTTELTPVVDLPPCPLCGGWAHLAAYMYGWAVEHSGPGADRHFIAIEGQTRQEATRAWVEFCSRVKAL